MKHDELSHLSPTRRYVLFILGTVPDPKLLARENGKLADLNGCIFKNTDLGVSKNRGTPKSSILIRFSIINHPFWGTPIFGNTHLRNFLPIISTETSILFPTSLPPNPEKIGSLDHLDADGRFNVRPKGNLQYANKSKINSRLEANLDEANKLIR